MLAAIVLPFCIKAFQPLQTQPLIAVIMLAGFLIAKRWLPRFSMLILLIIAIGCAFTSGALSVNRYFIDVLTNSIFFRLVIKCRFKY